MPIENFISIDQRSPYYLDSSKNQLYYAEAWALVHFLIYGPGMDNGKRLDDFVALLQKGVKQKEAFQQVFGDFKKIDKALEAYVLQPAFATSIFKESPEINEKSFSVGSLTVAERMPNWASFTFGAGMSPRPTA